MPSLTQSIKVGSVVHKRILKAIRARVKAAERSAARSKFVNHWKEAEEKALAYLPERAVDALRRVERRGGKPQYTTIQIPYSAAVMLASHTYWTTVFLGRNPVLQTQGLHGEGEMQVQAMDALMNYQVNVGEHMPVYHTWLYDAGKYGLGVITNYWVEEYAMVSSIEEQAPPSFAGVAVGKPKKVKTTRKIKGYVGNKVANVRPLDWFHDPRVTAANFQKGEFCGYWTPMPWYRLARGADAGIFMNVQEAKNKVRGGNNVDTQDHQSEVLDIPDPMSFGTAHVDGDLAAESIPCFEMYIDLVPKDWGLGESNINEKWVFVVDDKYQFIFAARPLGAYHDKFPFAVLKIDPEGYGVYTEGIPQATSDIQNTIDWLINSHFYNVRKTLNNEYVVDPSRIEMKDLKNPLPGGLIRLKPAAYGTDARTAMHQMQTQDVTRAHLSDLNVMLGLGERVTGVNDQIMGIANESSRRSATEVRSSNTFSVNRLKTTSEYFSAVGWAPHTRMLLQNTQQYYDGEAKFRLAGNSAAMLAGQQYIDVSPEAIAGSYDFVPVDGSLPVDRFAQANLWRTLLGEMRQIPPIMQQYDIGKIFAYVAQLTGLKNIEQFKIQVVPDGLLQNQMQQGNVVPMGGAPAARPGGTSIPGGMTGPAG